jgi:hypothetical protein
MDSALLAYASPPVSSDRGSGVPIATGAVECAERAIELAAKGRAADKEGTNRLHVPRRTLGRNI